MTIRSSHSQLWEFLAFWKICLLTFKKEEKRRHSPHPRTAVLVCRHCYSCYMVQLFNRRSGKARMAMRGLHTGTSDCMAKILSSFYTSLSRFWWNGRAEERYPTRQASVLPLQVVERRLGLGWLGWLSSLESGVLARNCAGFLPHPYVARQQSYRDVKIWVNFSMLSFECGNSCPCRTTQSLPCLKQHHPRYCRSL